MTQPTTALLLPIPTWGFSHAVAELEPLDRAPAFVLSPSRRARYCHRPRSGHRHPDGRVSLHAWCGQLLYNPLPIDRPDVVTPLCGTCEGRAVGAHWPAATDITSGAITFPVLPQRFTPRPYFDPPSRCPGSMSEFYLPTPTNWRRGTCMVCGADVKLRASSRGWWAAQDFGPERHAPVHMINPCRHHAWRHLTWIDHDRYLVGCRCQLEP